MERKDTKDGVEEKRNGRNMRREKKQWKESEQKERIV